MRAQKQCVFDQAFRKWLEFGATGVRGIGIGCNAKQCSPWRRPSPRSHRNWRQFSYTIAISHFACHSRMSHFTFRISHFAFRISHFAFRILHFALHTSHLAPRTQMFTLLLLTCSFCSVQVAAPAVLGLHQAPARLCEAGPTLVPVLVSEYHPG